jgi:mRNA interferase MazF
MARVLRRGDIVWADLDPVKGHEQAGHRPVLIISDDILNRHSGTVIAMALTSQPQRAGFPLTFPLPRKTGGKAAWVKISQIRTLSTKRLGKTVGRAEEADMIAILDGLNEILGN